jgi:polar amino acid transport system permease protein
MSFLDVIIFLVSRGVGVTIVLTIFAALLALVLGFIAGLARMSKSKIVRTIAAIYVEFFRGSSLLVLLFWIYFVLPLLGVTVSPMIAGILAMGLNFGAYVSEIVRSGFENVPEGQEEAGIAVNMTKSQRRWRIIFPQAFVLMVPNLSNQLIELFKATSLVSLITLSDLTYQAQLLNGSTYETTKIYVALLLIYFVLAWPLTKGMQLLERKLTEGKY